MYIDIRPVGLSFTLSSRWSSRACFSPSTRKLTINHGKQQMGFSTIQSQQTQQSNITFVLRRFLWTRWYILLVVWCSGSQWKVEVDNSKKSHTTTERLAQISISTSASQWTQQSNRTIICRIILGMRYHLLLVDWCVCFHRKLLGSSWAIISSTRTMNVASFESHSCPYDVYQSRQQGSIHIKWHK